MSSIYRKLRGGSASKRPLKFLLLLLVLSVSFTLGNLQSIPYEAYASPDPDVLSSYPMAHATSGLTFTATHEADKAYDRKATTYAEWNFEAPVAGSHLTVIDFTTGWVDGFPAPSAYDTITQVDFKMTWAATAANKRGTFEICFYVDPSGTKTSLFISPAGGAAYLKHTDTWTMLDADEPNNSDWDWQDINNTRFQVNTETQKPGTGVFQEYEAWLEVTWVPPSPAPIMYVDPASIVDDVTNPQLAAEKLTLRPSADGTFTQWTGTYNDWDETVQNGDTDYLYATSNNTKQSSLLPDHTSETWDIGRVRVVIYARVNETSDETLKPMLVIGGNPYAYRTTTVLDNVTYVKCIGDWTKNPATGTYWTWSDIDSLEAGAMSWQIFTWRGEVRATQLYVEVTGPRFSVDINVNYVKNLWSYQIEMSFNPNVLHGVYYNEAYLWPVSVGPFIGSAGGSVLRGPGPGWEENRLRLTGASLMPAAKFPTGGGVLATVEFGICGPGESNLTLGGFSALLNTTGYIILKQDNPGSFKDGYFRNGPSLSFSPETQTVSTSFTVDVNITWAVDLYHWRFNITYNTAYLTASGVSEGAFLGTGGTTTFSSTVNDAQGWVWANCSLTGDVPGVDDNGTLATISFNVDANGTSPLQFYEVYLRRYDYASKVLYVLPAGAFDGEVTVEIPSVPEFPFGAAIEIAVATVIVYIWLKGRRKIKIHKTGRPGRSISLKRI